MRSATPALLAMLNGAENAYVMADLYTITLLGGQVLRYTSYDLDVTNGGATFLSNALGFSRSRVKWVTGIEVDTLDVTIFAGNLNLVNGVPFLTQCERGILDGARIRLDRAFMTASSTAAETVYLFQGAVADIKVGRTGVVVQVKSDLDVLNVRMPRNIWQPPCLNTLFDSNCTKTKATYTASSSVVTAPSKTGITSPLTQAAGYFDLGALTFTSGANNGVSRTVNSYVNGSFYFAQPLPNICAPGDTFIVSAGCDKLLSTCTSKFANKVNFRGMPFIPVPETAL